MDDLLYTLFVVAWIGYGIYKGMKKNNSSKKSAPVQNRTQNVSDSVEEKPVGKKFEKTFESILSEVFDLPDPENDKTVHPYASVIDENSPKNAPVYEKYAEKELLDSYKGSDNVKSVFDRKKETLDTANDLNKNFDNQIEEEVEEDDNTVFDLRQAVIHQVILQRPY